MNKHYTSGMAMRESRPRSKRLQGLGAVASRTSSATLPWDLTVKSALFDSMFELVGSGTDSDPYLIHAKLPLYSDGEITAGGVGSGPAPGPATTLGALLNVDSEADDTPTTDKILVREAGSTHWTITDLADISGAVTGVRMNGTDYTPGADKVVNLGTVITSLAGYATEAYVSGNYLASSQKGAANGVAELDGSGKILFAQLPDAILGQLLYGGTVNASGVATLSTNVKTKLGISAATVQLTNDAGTYGYGKFEGVYFIMSADSGFASLGLKVGDWLISTGSAWKKIANTDAVTGVKGDAETDYRIGNVNITKANIGLGNVENTALSTWAGSANITKLGTITSGTWHGTAITKTYLSSSVQTSLDKADSALQSHQSIYQLTVQKNGVQMGTYTPNSAASTINIPDVASAQTLADLKTWIESMFEKDTASIPGKTLIHAKYDLYSNGEITAGGVGSGGGGGGSIVTWTQIQGAEGGVKIATITINGNVIDVYAPAGSIPPTPTDTYVFERYTASPVSVGASGGTVTIRVTSTKNGVNQYLNTSGITVTGGATVQSVSSSDNVTATLSIPNNTGAARSFSVTLIQPESGMSLTYSISQEAGQATGEVVDLKGIWSVSDRYQDTYPGYTCYKSNNHTDRSVGKMTVTLIGRSSLMMYFRSEAESRYDGLIANLDSEPTEEGANYFIDTKNRPGETFSIQLRNYGLDTGTHIVYAQYIKDGSQSTDPDEAYVWVPSEIPYVNSY